MVAIALLAPMEQGSDDYTNERMHSCREMDAPVEGTDLRRSAEGQKNTTGLIIPNGLTLQHIPVRKRVKVRRVPEMKSSYCDQTIILQDGEADRYCAPSIAAMECGRMKSRYGAELRRMGFELMGSDSTGFHVHFHFKLQPRPPSTPAEAYLHEARCTEKS